MAMQDSAMLAQVVRMHRLCCDCQPACMLSTCPCCPLQAMLDPERGTAVQIGATNYGLKDHATSYSPWAQEMQRHFAAFKDALGAASLPDALKAQMWENAIATGDATRPACTAP